MILVTKCLFSCWNIEFDVVFFRWLLTNCLIWGPTPKLGENDPSSKITHGLFSALEMWWAQLFNASQKLLQRIEGKRRSVFRGNR